MAPSPELSPPGTSTYSSDILNVGDGTWDSQRNTFLLPNLMGVNFEMMQYNGMGNRFRNMKGYNPLIRAHGVLAAMVFLGIVPAAILITRFSTRNPYWALRLHIWMQIMTLFLTTVVFMLGWFAVGPKRSLTNPHHGIGLAIYVLIIAQTLWGYLVHKTLKGKRRPHIPLNLMLHQWMGRCTALLGLAQIPLGLTLYGSPLSLFILYAIAVFAWLLFYFIMTYLRERHMGADYDSRGTYSTGPDDDNNGHGRLGRLAAVGAAGAGLAMLGRRHRGRSRSRSPDGRSDHTPRFDEKESRHERKSSGWGGKLFQLGALAGAAGLGKKFMDKRREREDDAESGRYRPAHAAADSLDDESIARPHGRPPGRHSPQPGPHDGSGTYSEYYTDSEVTRPAERNNNKLKTMLGAGAFAFGRKLFGGRNKAREEDRRVAEVQRIDEENERQARANSQRKRRPRSPISELTQTDLDVGPSHRPPPHDDFSGSEAPTSVAHGHRRHHSSAAAGAALAGAGHRRSSSRRRDSAGREGSFDSQPLSIKVRTHNNGRNITLRQLTRDETLADREARRRERARSGRRRRDNSLSENEADSHWRRVEERERLQAQEMRPDEGDVSTIGPSVSAMAPPAADTTQTHSPNPASMPLPPPVMRPTLTSPLASTDLSGSYASRSERRRVERRVARHARQHSVEFT